MYCTTQDIYNIPFPNPNLAVSLDDVKSHLRITGASEDDQLTMMIKKAMRGFEQVSRRSLMTNGFQTFRDCWQQCFELRRSPLVDVTSVKYKDENNVEQTVSSDDYYVVQDPFYSLVEFGTNFNYPALFERKQSIEIDFSAGYGADDTEIPDDIKVALMEHVAFLYENRGDCGCEGLNGIPNQVRQQYQWHKVEEISC